ncbi:MAG: Glu/Leu/Phe/Val dehydrogenase dimerization domain-containing protein [Pseudomonadota bacterium]
MLKDQTKKKLHTGFDRLCRYADLMRFGEVHMKFDHNTHLKAIVAIHNLNRGPAIGGCRLVSYSTTNDAFEDALRLAYMMSYKAAINDLPHGGGKAVLMMPKVMKDRVAFFEKFGEFVNDLNGRYITAVDSGTSPEDMDIIATRTPFVSCTSHSESSGDPSPHTAFGVMRAMEAAVKFKLNRDSLADVHVAIQGAGHVGYYLAKSLHAVGARITMCDVKQAPLDRVIEEFGVNVVPPEKIYEVEADIFAPCALGAILNLHNIKRLKVKIIAGSANNQLAHHQNGDVLHERGILYAPDFLINAGGLIQVAVIYDHANVKKAHQAISDIYVKVMNIFEESARLNMATSMIAEKIAEIKLKEKLVQK